MMKKREKNKLPVFIPPKTDFMFKGIFGDDNNKPLLASLLQAATHLPKTEFTDLEIRNPFLLKKAADDKEGILDIRVKTRSGKMLDIEIQVYPHPKLVERVIYYLAKMVVGQIDEGGDYAKIHRTISVCILDFVLFADSPNFYHSFQLHDPKNGVSLTDLLEVITLEIPKIPVNANGDPLVAWLKFINAKNFEEAKIMSASSPVLRQAYGHLERLNQDQKMQELYWSREIGRMDRQVREQVQFEEGERQGERKGKLEAAREFKHLGVKLKTISEATGLTLAEIKAL